MDPYRVPARYAPTRIRRLLPPRTTLWRRVKAFFRGTFRLLERRRAWRQSMTAHRAWMETVDRLYGRYLELLRQGMPTPGLKAYARDLERYNVSSSEIILRSYVDSLIDSVEAPTMPRRALPPRALPGPRIIHE